MKDEVLIQMRPGMSENEIGDVLEKCSNVLHRLLQLSIDAGARGHLTYFTHLVTACGAAEAAVYILRQPQQQQSSILRPQ
jgi:hypothetical protein